MEIEVCYRDGLEADAGYYIRHDFDLDVFAGIPGEGPYSSAAEALEAADRIVEALSCVAD